jgi:TonB family protein
MDAAARARRLTVLSICYALAGSDALADSLYVLPQPDPAETPAHIDPQRPLKIGQEFYPKESINSREEGKCLVKLKVDTSGNIHDPSIVTSSGFARLDAACIAAVSSGHLVPATRNGVPVESSVSLPIEWKLPHPATLADCMSIPAEDPPPHASDGSPVSGRVLLRLFVAETGDIEGVKIAKSSGYPRLDEAGVKAVTGQKLTPATSEGHPMATCVTLPIVFNLKP